jgi:hypothetical protein
VSITWGAPVSTPLTNASTSVGPVTGLSTTPGDRVLVYAIANSQTVAGVRPTFIAPVDSDGHTWTLSTDGTNPANQWKTGTPSIDMVVWERVRVLGDTATSLTPTWGGGTNQQGNAWAGWINIPAGTLDPSTPLPFVVVATPAAANPLVSGSFTAVGGTNYHVLTISGNRNAEAWADATDANIHDTRQEQGALTSSACIVFQYSGATSTTGAARSVTGATATGVNLSIMLGFKAAASSSSSAVGMTQVSAMSVTGQSGTTSGVAMAHTSSMGVTPRVDPSQPVGMAQTSTMGIVASTPVTRFLGMPPQNRIVAHRFFDNDNVEFTMVALRAAMALGVPAVNFDGVLTADGYWMASHDTTTGRVFSGTSQTIATSNWVGNLQNLTTITGGLPAQLCSDLISAAKTINPDVVFYGENKLGTSYSSWTSMLTANGLTSANFVGKIYGPGASGAVTAYNAAGFVPIWVYGYDADIPTIATWQAYGTQLGMDYLASSSDWTTTLSYGKFTLGHVTPSAAAVATAYSLGANGVMSGKGIGVQPGAVVAMSQTSSMGVTGSTASGATVAMVQASTMGTAGQASRTASVPMAQTSSMGTSGQVSRTSAVAMSGTSVMGVAGIQTLFGTVSMAQASTMGVAGNSAPPGSVNMVQTSSMTVTGSTTTFSTAPMVQASAMTVTGGVSRIASVAMAQLSVMGVSGGSGTIGTVAMVGTSSMTVSGSTSTFTAAAMVQQSVMGVTQAAPAVYPIVVTGSASPAVNVTGSVSTAVNVTSSVAPTVTVR